MATVLSIVNCKGGVGKSTTACCLASLAEMCGKKVLLVDMDPQANATKVFRCFDASGKSSGTKDILLSDVAANKAVRKSPNSNIDLISSDPLHKQTAKLLYRKEFETGHSQEAVLRDKINKLGSFYDLVVIDNGPASDILSMNSLTASDYCISPVEADGFSYEGLQSVLEDISKTKEKYNGKLEFLGLLMGRCEVRTTLFTQLYRQFVKEFGDYAIRQPIRKDNAVKEAMTAYQPLYRYQRRTKAGTDFIKAAYEIGLIDEDERNKLLDWHGMKNDQFDISRLLEV